MNMPGFTSEASLPNSTRNYLVAASNLLFRGGATVEPQQDRGDIDCTEGPCRGGRQRICCRVAHCYMQYSGPSDLVCSWGRPFCYYESC
jgi:hypothetical protein